MVLEATVLVADNSEWMRNGDYTPSRLEAQNDALTFLFNAKTQSNPENTVGLLTMGGKAPNLLVTLTDDIGKILAAVHKIKISGSVHVNTAIQIAQLVLKHRENKNQRQRIIMFVGSPVQEDQETLVKLGKKLKKNGVAVDVVNFGQEAENTVKLQAFIDAVNNSDNSHLLSIPPGPHILSDMIFSSPIVSGEDGPPPGMTGGSYEFGVDPNLDPELALALRISMEEERARIGGAEGSSSPSKMERPPTGATVDDEMLAQALAMSMNDGDVEMGDEVDDELAKALALSMQGPGIDLNSVLDTLPGVNKDDPRIKEALEESKKKKDESKK